MLTFTPEPYLAKRLELVLRLIPEWAHETHIQKVANHGLHIALGARQHLDSRDAALIVGCMERTLYRRYARGRFDRAYIDERTRKVLIPFDDIAELCVNESFRNYRMACWAARA